MWLVSLWAKAVILPVGSITAFAADEFAGGTGVNGDPWLIETAEQLNNVRNHLDGYFELIGDIDLNVAPYNTGSDGSVLTLLSREHWTAPIMP